MKRIFMLTCLMAFVAGNLYAQDDCSSITLGRGQEYNCKIGSRSYLLYAPDSYKSDEDATLVVDCHGLHSNAEEQAGLEPHTTPEGITYSGMGSGYRMVADREGFIVATPQNNKPLWMKSDLRFLDKVIAEIKNAAAIDRVYITGISSGGKITYWAGKSSDYMGLSPVAAYWKGELRISRHAPLIAFHSPDDSTILYRKGKNSAKAWARANHCDMSGPYHSMTFGGSETGPEEVCYKEDSLDEFELVSCDKAAPPATCEIWDQCDDGVEVVFCTVPPDPGTDGHVLYRNGTKLSLAAVAWEFWNEF